MDETADENDNRQPEGFGILKGDTNIEIAQPFSVFYTGKCLVTTPPLTHYPNELTSERGRGH